MKSAPAGPCASSRAQMRFMFFRPRSVTLVPVLAGLTIATLLVLSACEAGIATPVFRVPTTASTFLSATTRRAAAVPVAGSA